MGSKDLTQNRNQPNAALLSVVVEKMTEDEAGGCQGMSDSQYGYL